MLFFDQLTESNALLIVAGALVLGLLLGAGLITAWRALRRPARLAAAPRSGRARLAVVESLDLDQRRRLLIVRRDDVEHLIIVGGSSDLYIEGEFSSRKRSDPQAAKFREETGAAPQIDPAIAPSFDAPKPAPHQEPATTVPSGQIPPIAIDDTGRAAPQRAPAFPLPQRRVPPPIGTIAQRSPLHREPPLGRGRPQPRQDEKIGETPTLPASSEVLRTPASSFGRLPQQSAQPPAAKMINGAAHAERVARETTSPQSKSPLTPSPGSSAAQESSASETSVAAVTVTSDHVLDETSAVEDSALLRDPIDDMLEAEMARLLGRRPSP